MRKLKCLDLFCCGGGCSMGYYQAGFEVVGVDNEPQKNYPFDFIQGDAFEYLAAHWQEFDLIHASPKCQKWSTITKTGTKKEYPDQVAPIREMLIATGKPYVIENVERAPLFNAITLCGTMFGLNIIRHRKFETNPRIDFAPAACCHHKRVVKHGRPPDHDKHFAAATGHFSDVEFVGKSMGIDWMGQAELAQAIPPAYTRWIGGQIINYLGYQAA